MERESRFGILKGNIQIRVIEESGTLTPMIYGDPEGFVSFGKLLIALGETDQEECVDLPHGEREHEHLIPNYHLTKESVPLIIGRLDAKGTGAFPDGFENERRKSDEEVFDLYIYALPKAGTPESKVFNFAYFTCLVDAKWYTDAEMRAIASFGNGNWVFERVTKWCINSIILLDFDSCYSEDIDKRDEWIRLYEEAKKHGIAKSIDFKCEIVEEDV